MRRIYNLLILVLILCFLFTIPLISAATFNVQNYSSAGTTGTQLNFTINPVDQTDSFILLQHRQGTDATPQTLWWTPKFENDSLISTTRYTAGTAAPMLLEVVETGKQTVQAGEVTILAGSNQTNITLNPVDLSETFVKLYSRCDSATNADNHDGFFSGNLTNSTNLLIRRAGENICDATIYYQVIEYDGAIVQSGETSLSGVASTTASISAVNLSDTFLVFNWHSVGDDVGMDTNMIRGNLTSTTQITFDRVSTIGSDERIIDWYVVSIPGAKVQRGDIVLSLTTPVDQNINPVNISRSFIIKSHHDTGTGSGYDNQESIVEIFNSTTIRSTKGTGNQDTTINWQVIELPTPPIIISNLTNENETGVINGTVNFGDNVTINATVEDLGSGISNVWITIWDGIVGGVSIFTGFLSNIAGDLWSIIVPTDDTFNLGENNYTIYANDSEGTTYEANGTFDVEDNVYPQFSNYDDNNGTIINSGTAHFNVTVTDTNGTVFLEINGTNYTATPNNLTSQLGILDLTANGGINPATGQAWKEGDTYYLVFSSSLGTNASNDDLDYYNIFVNDLATTAGYGTATWKAIVSNTTKDARDNINVNDSSPDGGFFLMDGQEIISNNIADFWNGHLYTEDIDLDENGAATNKSIDYVCNSWQSWGPTWTGTDSDGTANSGGEIDSAQPILGLNYHDGAAQWINRGNAVNRSCWFMVYGISEALKIRGGNGIYNVSVNLTAPGTYPYYWGSWGDGPAANYNTSSIQSYTVLQDTNPPIITNITYQNETGVINGSIPRSADVTINATVTDEVMVDTVWVTVWQDVIGGTILFMNTLTNIVGDSWSIDIPTNTSFNLGENNFTIYANDSLNQTSEQNSTFFLEPLRNNTNLDILFTDVSETPFKTNFSQGENFITWWNWTLIPSNIPITDTEGYCNVTFYDVVGEFESSIEDFTVCDSGCTYDSITDEVFADVSNLTELVEQDYIGVKLCYEDKPGEDLNVTVQCGAFSQDLIIDSSKFGSCGLGLVKDYTLVTGCVNSLSMNITLNNVADFDHRVNISEFGFDRVLSQHEESKVFYNASNGLWRTNETYESYIPGPLTVDVNCTHDTIPTLDNFASNNLTIINAPPVVAIMGIQNLGGYISLYNNIVLTNYPGNWTWINQITDFNLDTHNLTWYNGSNDAILSLQETGSAGTHYTPDGIFNVAGNPYRLTVWANDTLGAYTEANLTFNVSEPFITTTILYPIDSQVYNETQTEINYSASTNTGTLDSCWYSFDDGATNSSAISAGTNFTGLSINDGDHTLDVYCNSSTGYEDNDEIDFEVNTQPNTLLIFPQEEDYELTEDINITGECRYTNGTWCGASIYCRVTSYYPNSTLFFENELMTQTNPGYYNFVTTNPGISGHYSSSMSCYNGAASTAAFTYTVNFSPGPTPTPGAVTVCRYKRYGYNNPNLPGMRQTGCI